MSDDDFEREVLERVPMDRRSFVKKVVMGTAFVAPIVTSFGMDSLTMSSARAQVPNQVS